MGQLSVIIILSVFCEFTSCFWRRRYHSCNDPFLQSACFSPTNSHEQAILADNWVYIDGGDIMDQGRYFQNNDTNGLDLSKNWSNSSLVLTRTERPANAVSLSGQALWFDEKRNLIYCFGGFRSRVIDYLDPPYNSIWAFTPDGRGTGNWKEVLGPTGANTFPSEIIRPYAGGFCNDEDYGYYVGGYVSKWSTRSVQTSSARVSRGLLKFHFDDLQITNTSDGDYGRAQSRDDIAGSGKMVNVPTFGTEGVIIVLGEGDKLNAIPFNNITIYDKTKQSWYSQRASGDLPVPRSDFCIVGIPGTAVSDSFEIFMYGGVIDYTLGPDTENSDQIYILSLPAFQWFKAIYPPGSSRSLHTCHTTNTNQMIIIGGVDPRNDTQYSGSANFGSEPVDPWPEGIGIFDMTALKFKDSYEANAKQYETPELIKRFYNDTSKRYPATWNSPAVKELFQTKSNQTSNSSNPETLAPTNSSIAQPSPSHLSSGSIAGIVLGTIAVLTLCAIAIFTVRKRTKNPKLKPQISKAELPIDQCHELHASAKLPKLTAKHEWRTELANTGVIELFDTSRPERLELP